MGRRVCLLPTRAFVHPGGPNLLPATARSANGDWVGSTLALQELVDALVGEAEVVGDRAGRCPSLVGCSDRLCEVLAGFEKVTFDGYELIGGLVELSCVVVTECPTGAADLLLGVVGAHQALSLAK